MTMRADTADRTANHAEPIIRPFLFEGEVMVRVVERDTAPWFIAKDVCAAIGVNDVSQACEKLDPDERGPCSIRTLGGLQDVLAVSEGGLYTLVLRSRDATKPGTVAHRFRRWVTSEVLPTIRQTGRYENPSRKEAFDEEPQTADSLKLRKVGLVLRIFGERSAAQLYTQLGLERVPAMAAAFAQIDLFEPNPPGTVTVTVTPSGHAGGAA